MRTRICIKRDEESPIGRGAILLPEHFRPEILPAMVEAVEATKPEHVEHVWIVEGWRDIRDTPDSHEDCRALDFVGSDATGARNVSPAQFRAWAARVQARLGDRYYVLAHDAGSGWHLHIQFNG